VLGLNQDLLGQAVQSTFVLLEAAEVQQTGLLLAEAEGVAAVGQRGERVRVELLELALRRV
jgi:hypothetical protein